MRRLAFVLAVLLPLLPSPPLQANMLEVFGASSRNQGMGSTGVASSNDFSALFYNPALLTRGEDSFALEFTHGFADMDISLRPRPSGFDPTGYDLRAASRSNTTGLPTLWGITLGAMTDFGTDFLAMGLMAYLPSFGSMSLVSHYANEREQYFSNQVHWELLGDRLQTQVVLAGVAVRPVRWLMVGAGFSYSLESDATLALYTTDVSDPEASSGSLELRQSANIALTAGIAADLPGGFRLGFSMRDEQDANVRGWDHIEVAPDGDNPGYTMLVPTDYNLHVSPATYSAGLSWKREGLEIATDLSYVRWSQYSDSSGTPARFSNTFDWGIGAELSLLGIQTRLGFRYTPSPVPEQTGRTNYADNDRFMISGGVGGRLHLLGMTADVDFHLQALILPDRTHNKEVLSNAPACDNGETALCDEDDSLSGLQTGNPGFPGYSSGGFVLAGGLTVKWVF